MASEAHHGEPGARTERPRAMTLETGRQLGSYEIVAPLGADGMGEVYRAVDRKLGHDGDLPPTTVPFLLFREHPTPRAKDGQRQEQMEGHGFGYDPRVGSITINHPL